MNELALYRARVKRVASIAAIVAAVLLGASFVMNGVASNEYAQAMASYEALTSYGTTQPFLTAAFAEAELAATQSIAFPLLVMGIISTVISLICLTLCLVSDLLQAHKSSDAKK